MPRDARHVQISRCCNGDVFGRGGARLNSHIVRKPNKIAAFGECPAGLRKRTCSRRSQLLVKPAACFTSRTVSSVSESPANIWRNKSCPIWVPSAPPRGMVRADIPECGQDHPCLSAKHAPTACSHRAIGGKDRHGPNGEFSLADAGLIHTQWPQATPRPIRKSVACRGRAHWHG